MSFSTEGARPSGAMGWLALLAMGLLVFATTMAGAAGLLFYAFTPLCVAIGLALLNRPAAYIVFTLGVWIWAPFVRRIVDWETFYHQLNPVLLAPPLLAGLTFLAHRTWRNGLAQAPAFAVLALPFAWALAVGFIDNGITPAAYALLAWAGPVVFGLYVLGARQREPGLESIVLGGLAVLAFTASVYGVFQFIDPTIWDRRWMINSEMPVLGAPTAFAVRVFGPLNSPVPFAAVMVAGFIAAILDPRPWPWVLAPTMFVALLLSLVRSEWVALVVGITAIVAVAGVASLGRVIRMFVVSGLVIAMGLPLLAYEPIHRAVDSRLESFRAGSSDVSLRERTILYQNITFDEPLKGSGLGSTDNATRLASSSGRLDPNKGTVDSALIQLATTYGMPMAAVYLGVVGWLAASSIASARRSSSGLAGLAIVAASLSQLPSYNMLISVAALLLYFGLAMSLPVRRSEEAWDTELEAFEFPEGRYEPEPGGPASALN